MRYLSVIPKNAHRAQRNGHTCPLTDSKRVHVIDQTISVLSDYYG